MDNNKRWCNPNLEIDQERTVRILENLIGQMVKEARCKGVIFGLNGGLDSAVLACLAVRSLGPRLVHAWFLYDRHSEKDSLCKAATVAEWLGIDLHTEDINQNMPKVGGYTSLIMQGKCLPRWFNRLVHKGYSRLFGETPFMSSLRLGSGAASFSLEKRFAYDLTVRPVLEGFEARHIHRRRRLEQKARDLGSLLLGATNRSELLVGWFVKNGIDDLPIQPLSGLYKTQIYQMAAFLNIPEKIRASISAAGMPHGIAHKLGTDMNFETLDAILDMIADEMSERKILAHGITPQQLALVCQMHRLSAWKRTNHMVRPPVDGGPDSNLRKGFRRTPAIAIPANTELKPTT
jgi:NAD+ synthase